MSDGSSTEISNFQFASLSETNMMGNASSTPYVPDAKFEAKRFYDRCISVFGTVEGLRALASKRGYLYHSPNAMFQGMVNGCPLCNAVFLIWYPWSKVDDDHFDINLGIDAD
jgi:hypothetical protein